MFKNIFGSKEPVEIGSVGYGVVRELTEVPDKMFSQKMLGDGYALDLQKNEIYAPIDGELISVFPTGHAFGIKNKDLELLIHVGIDTVELEGQHFDLKVNQGDTVKRGDLLVSVDLDKVKDAGYSTMTPVVITSGEEMIMNRLGQVVTPETIDIITIKE